ncbi:nucleoside triphosphate pyrophosphohydrolase [Thermoflavimicrobium daqui]|jgi:predicted house-cleaning noncanonical NTP pyrophosphatase (MazG superfamily)|uniref:Phosphoribosyl-ATP pyrophosphohydrolase n=1 Tax=Thermoflavimicrobium daqui TaxID=2137476 RepID=A0A364K405_9BACL|nr:nucleoside triphosphate pyrophosphohydrolase [Thermoflavimicrobium daqui]RAL24095.1 phosphoribosyl-ATP pyrophosphohydrolase [Thermoflavimicrobium daqui]
MKVKVYNKLVRDKIPQIVKQANKKPCTYIATEEEIKPMLLKKLIEELEEFKVTPNEEELADILEVIDGIAHAFNLDMDKVLEVKADKLKDRGGFKHRIILEKIIE